MASSGASGDEPVVRPTEVAVNTHPGVDVVAIKGDLDMQSGISVREVVLDDAQVAQDRVVLDLSDVDFMDSMGVRTIFSCRKHLASRGAQLSLVLAPDTRVFKLVRSLGMDVIVDIYDSPAAAVSAVGASAGS